MSEKVEVPNVIVLNCFTDIEVEFHRGTDALNGLMDETKDVDVTGFVINVVGVVVRFGVEEVQAVSRKKGKRLVEGAYGGRCFLHRILNSCDRTKIADVR
jgi:hypothetical protein